MTINGSLPSEFGLPTELYRPIFQQLSSRLDLYNLLFLSKSLLHEVEECLYRVIVVDDMAKYLPLFDRLAAPEQHRFATYVRDLTLPEVSPHWKLVHQALKAMVNLRRLTVNGDLADPRGDTCMISDCAFQLRSLTTYGFEPRFQRDLERQTLLEELLIPDIMVDDSDEEDLISMEMNWEALPNIKVLSGGSARLLKFLGETRSLKGVEWMSGIPPPDMRVMAETVAMKLWVLSFEDEILDTILRPFSSLRHLYCVIWGPDINTTHIDAISSPVIQKLEVIHFYFVNGSKLEVDHFAPMFEKWVALREIKLQGNEEDMDTCQVMSRDHSIRSEAAQPLAWKASCEVDLGL